MALGGHQKGTGNGAVSLGSGEKGEQRQEWSFIGDRGREIGDKG